MAVRTWVWIVIIAVTAMMVGCVAIVGTGVYFVARRADVQSVSPATAAQRIEEARARFQGQTPLVEIDDDLEDVRLHRRDRPSAVRPETLHVLAWNPREERLVSLSIPFWLLRLTDMSMFDFSFNRAPGLDKLELDVADLDRHGPGLILDLDDLEDIGRVLIWTE